MSKYFENIVSQPVEWQKSFDYCHNQGFDDMLKAKKILANSCNIVITGIGASYNAGLLLQNFFWQKGLVVHLIDSSEFLHAKLSPDTTVIILSRSGKSIEIVQALQKCKDENLKTIGIGNNTESSLAQQSDIFLYMNVAMDYSVSVSTYSAIILVGYLLSEILKNDKFLCYYESLFHSFLEKFPFLFKQIEDFALYHVNELDIDKPTYFLGRTAHYGSVLESVLLWHEVAKQPATHFLTGSFRHGPQEVLTQTINAFIFLNETDKEKDLALAKDLAKLGAHTFVVGTNVPDMEGIATFNLETFNPLEIHLLETVIMQTFAYHIALKKNYNPDEFIYCNYVVENEGGIL